MLDKPKETKSLKNLTSFDYVRKFMQSRKYSRADKDLKRYSKYELRDYIEYCCENNYYIEGYILTIQYVDDLVTAFINDNKRNIKDAEAPVIFKTLYSLGLIDDILNNLYLQTKEQRNILGHKIIANPKELDNIKKMKPETHKKRLLNLLDKIDETYITWVKNYTQKFTRNEPKNAERNKRFMDILLREITPKIVNRLTNITDEKTREESFKKEYLIEFHNFLIQKGIVK